MKTLISTTALAAGLFITPSIALANNGAGHLTPLEKCERGENRRQVLGGLAGATAGGVIGNQIAGRGDRAVGSAIGVIAGGLAGVGIAGQTVDCDPVFRDQDVSGTHSQTVHHGSTIQTVPVVHGSTQPYYEDRVTVSNHPVYSDPYYGAGALSQGTTYSAGTVAYPPAGNNSQYYTSQTYATPTTTAYYPQSQPAVQNVVYTTSSQPTYSQPSYSQPVFAQTQYTPVSREHFHGRHSCNMIH